MINQINPFYQAFLTEVKEAKELSIAENLPPTIESVRANADGFAMLALPKLDVKKIEQRSFSFDGRDIPIRIYDPKPEQSKPVMIYCHGGGHILGSLDLFDPISRRLAAINQCLVITVDYRLAPEHLYPAGLEDCIAVSENLSSVLTEYSVNLDHIILCGDSAGGNLAISTCYHLHDQQNNVHIDQLVLFYPGVDYSLKSVSESKFAKGLLLEADEIQWQIDQYFPEGADRIAASPLFFDNLSRLPSTLILAAQNDPFVHEGHQFRKKLIEAGVACEYEAGEGLIHCYINLEKLNPDAIDQTYQRIADFIHR